MSPHFYIVHDRDVAIELRHGNNRLLLRYVYRPQTPNTESPRPYAHPVCSLAGEVLTNFRPNDHPWHHGLSFTINRLDAANYWGGPSYRAGDGYRWRSDHGTQRHVGWKEIAPSRLEQLLEWPSLSGGLYLRERRILSPLRISETAWSLRWQAELENVSGRNLVAANCYSAERLAGSHYTGLQFRGARALLDEHGDPEIALFADGMRSKEEAINGSQARALEWHGRTDTTLRRVGLRFENNLGPLHWFFRRENPLIALPFQYDRDITLAPGETLSIDHTLVFTDL
ncbi:MAG: PmoA family protein [Nibricoccus sp.]